MSGTSLDGIDAALVEFHSKGPQCIATFYQAYPEKIRAEVVSLQNSGNDELHRSAVLANLLADAYGKCVKELLRQAGYPPEDIAAIGCHGQTIRHAPREGYSIQLNNPARLAEITGIAVVADFRSRDLAAGGQGAPLVPAFHDCVFRAKNCHRAILNIGGIANVTDLAPGRPTVGFDCGPGNILLDSWIRENLNQSFDDSGRWAQQGKEIEALLTRLLSHPFLSSPPPKSCGWEQFNIGWLKTMLTGTERAEDVQATLAHLTAAAVVDAVSKWCGQPKELYVCGGGAHNAAVMSAITSRLRGTHVATTTELGLPPDWVEAVAFAWLARQTILGQTGNLPEVTGAIGKRTLGAIYPA